MTKAQENAKKRQARVLRFLKRYQMGNYGNAPSIRQIALGVASNPDKIPSKSTINNDLRALANRGRVVFTDCDRVRAVAVAGSVWVPPHVRVNCATCVGLTPLALMHFTDDGAALCFSCFDSLSRRGQPIRVLFTEGDPKIGQSEGTPPDQE